MSDHPATSSTEHDRVGEIVSSLPERWRQPFMLRMLDSRSFRQIEKETGVSWSTIQGWSQRAEWKAAAKELWKFLAAIRVDDWRVLRRAADRELLAVLEGEGSAAADKLRAVTIVLDRTGLAPGQQLVDPDAGNDAAPPLHTPEGREAALVELASLPPDLLIEALRRLREAAPEHLREGLPDV